MNFFDFLDIQKQEGRQAFIIHYPADSGKTHFTQRACQLLSGLYLLDLLEQFRLDHSLRIQEFKSEQLQNYLLSFAYPVHTHTILVDNGDFLFNTWTNQEKEKIIQWFKYPLRTPSVTDKTFILIIQTDATFSLARLQNSRGESRILALNAFEAL